MKEGIDARGWERKKGSMHEVRKEGSDTCTKLRKKKGINALGWEKRKGTMH